MTLLPGVRVGPYEVLAKLGEGGMGEVYRARDTKLNRDVALKVLPDALAADAERLSRFRREAQVLASLNHPAIASIYGFEDSAPTGSGQAVTHALVLELVDGPTLADRVTRGPIPLDEALPIAAQIAEAVDAAHEQGIIHRDLKPANIKLRPDGTVKVLDFGLAKALEPSSPINSGLTAALTITTPAQMTAAGTILGTAAYMSPEQAKGAAADKRCDAWAFGCVLYEMLTGRLAFEGDSVAEVLGAIFKTEPDWNRLPAAVPEGIRRLLRRCLQRDRRLRQQSLGDARIEIEEAMREPARAVAVAPRRRAWLPWTAAALATLAGLAEGLWLRRSPPEPAREVRFEVATPTTTDPTSLAVSPDGAKIVFVATSEGRRQLWLRSLATIEARPLAGTEDGLAPFWSPDSRSLAFFSGGRLNRLDLDNGLVRALAIAPNPLGGAWSRDGTVLFTPNYTGPIFRTSATGGDAQPLTRMETGQASHAFPAFLSDSRHFLYFVTGTTGSPGVYIGQLDGQSSSRLLDADAPAVFALNQVLFVRQGTVFAQEIDLAALALRASPVAVAEQVPVEATSNLAAVSASPSGTLAYRSGAAGGERRFIWFDRSGRELEKVWESDRAVSQMSISADRRHLFVSRLVNGNTDIWAVDVARGVPRRVTFDPAADLQAVPAPDGARIVFNSNRSGLYDLYVTSAAGNGSEDLLLATPQNKSPGDWSSDGRFVLFRSPGKTTGFDLWALPMDGDRKPFPVVQTNFEERDGQFSPDGKWIAYQSNESGRFEIYVQPFPKGSREPISSGGGAQVRWRPDGRELFYIALDGRLMAVPITYAAGGRRIEAGVPVPLFTTRVGGALQGPNQQQYVVSTDGQRFLMSTVTETRTPAITVVLNWKPGAAER